MTNHSACPDNEALAALIDGTLAAEQREQVIAHAADCAACCFVLAGTLRFLEDERKEKRRARREELLQIWRRRVAVAGIAAALTIVGYLVGVHVHPGQRGPDSLLEAVASDRPTKARLTGGFRYAPRAARASEAPTKRGSTAGDLRIAAAALPIIEKAQAAVTAASLQELGRAYVLLGNRAEALDSLDAAMVVAQDRFPPQRRADLLTDIAAARLEEWLEAGDPAGPVMALAAADRALRLAPSLPEALFNRALALEELGLRGQATDAWHAYLAVDATSGWAEEARASLERLAPSPTPEMEVNGASLVAAADALDADLLGMLVRQGRYQARQVVEDELLGEWGDAWPDGNWRGKLEAARSIASSLESQTGDRLLALAVGEIDQRLSKGPTAVSELARGHAAYRRGRIAFEELSIPQAEAAFREARTHFDAAGSVFTLWARDWLAGCAYYRGEGIDEIGPELGAIEADARRLHADALLGRALWLRGLAEFVGGDLAASVLAYREALDVFIRLDEPEHSAVLHYLLAEATMVLGDDSTSWEHRLAAFRLLPAIPGNPKVASILQSAAVAALAIDAPEAALSFLRESPAASSPNDPTAKAEASITEARILQRLGLVTEARKTLARAAIETSSIPDPYLARRVTAEFAVTAATVLPEALTADRLAAVGEAITSFEAQGIRFRLPELYLARARLQLARGEHDQANSSLLAAFRVLRNYPPPTANRFWSSPWGAGRELVQAMVKLQIQRFHRPDEGLRYAELWRAHSEGMPPGNEALPSADLEQAVPRGGVLLYYFSLGDSLARWSITPSESTLAVVDVSDRKLAQMTATFVREIEAAGWNARAEALSRQLHALLLPGQLETGERLIVIPDQSVAQVPFGLLRDPKTQRFLVEERAITVLPDAVRLESLGQGGGHSTRSRPESVLTVGDPAVDARLFPHLPRIPAAEGEARHVGVLYPTARSLTGRQATEATFKRSAGHFDVLHVAAHALPNTAAPGWASLPLAPDPFEGETGALFAHEIAQLPLRGVKTVVLSGCGTGRSGTGPGPASLARAFLAAGAGSVIGTLWRIDDESAEALALELHRRLAVSSHHVVQAEPGDRWVAIQR